MKLAMLTLSVRYFWVFSSIWASCQIIGVSSIDTLTTQQMPDDILKSLRQANGSEILQILNNTRRIILGRDVDNTRPYMVYLKLPTSNAKYLSYKRWLCGGVIVHEEYILTSAACIEDVRNFYVVSGTNKFSFAEDRFNNVCIKNGAKKAIWKCIPKNYVFDGHENDNIRWMNNDIAVVKVEDEFDFSRRVRGCDYAPRPICYNNQSGTFEQAETTAAVAGWGTAERYGDWVNVRKSGRRAFDIDRQDLMEAPVLILEKSVCKKLWGRRYHHIIENYMICTSDMTSEISLICSEKYVDCTDIMSESNSEEDPRRSFNPEKMRLHSGNHLHSSFRRNPQAHDGGFCENDHGGPLIYGTGSNSLVIGIISACLVKERTNKCYGPFLYTSVWKNKVLINCAIYKDHGQGCNKLFRAGGATHTEVEMSWADHPDGPAKNEIKAMRRKEELETTTKVSNKTIENNTHINSTDVSNTRINGTNVNQANSSKGADDMPVLRSGVILRAGKDEEDETKGNQTVT